MIFEVLLLMSKSIHLYIKQKISKSREDLKLIKNFCFLLIAEVFTSYVIFFTHFILLS